MKRSQFKQTAVITIAVLFTTTISPGNSSAAFSDSGVEPVVTFIAADDGVDRATAQATAAFEASADSIDAIASAVLLDRDAGLAFNHGSLEIRVKGSRDSQLEALLLTQLGSAKVDLNRVHLAWGFKYSPDELGDLSASISDVILKQFPNARLLVTPQSEKQNILVNLPEDYSSDVSRLLQATFPNVPVQVAAVSPATLPKTATCSSASPNNNTASGNWSCTAPLRGGVEMLAPYSGGGSAGTLCSTGLMARSKTDNKLYVLTAGHCIQTSDIHQAQWNAVFPGGGQHVIGPGHNENFGQNDNGDAGIIAVTNTNWTARAWILVKDLPTYVEDYAVGSTGGTRVGQRVCKSGRTTGTSCGTVSEVGVSAAYCEAADKYGNCQIPTTLVSYLAKNSAEVRGGDSGGPVFASHVAFGIVSGAAALDDGTFVYSLYTGVARDASDMNVDIALEAP